MVWPIILSRSFFSRSFFSRSVRGEWRIQASILRRGRNSRQPRCRDVGRGSGLVLHLDRSLRLELAGIRGIIVLQAAVSEQLRLIRTVKRILGYGGHLLAATIGVPWLTMLAAGVAYGLVNPFLTSLKTPQQFLSEHLVFLVVIVGASLGYSVSRKFTGRSALWIWIPAALVFVIRVLDWRETGSVLVGPGSFIEHFRSEEH